MALKVRIIAQVEGKEVPWEELTEEQKTEIATKLHDDAMKAAGYIKKETTKAAG